MNVAIFSESYLPLRNGVAVSVSTLTDELTKMGHNVYIFAPAYRGYKDASDNVIRLPSFRTIVEPEYPIPYPFFIGVAEKVKRLNVEIIHTQTPWQLGWLGMRLARRFHIPLVSTNHTKYADYAHYFPLAPQSFTRVLIINMMRNYYNHCDAVITPSTEVSNMLTDYGVSKPIYVIPTGISKPMFRNQDGGNCVRKRYGIAKDDLVIVYAGRLAKEKNLILLFNVFNKLAETRPNLWLMLVGGGPYETECESLKSGSPFGDRIVMTGSVPREDIVNYYSAGDVFAFPSLTDTQGLVICEALQAGLPCVGVRAGGTPEMITEFEDGFLTDNTVEDFSAKLAMLMDDNDLRRKFSERAVHNSMRFTAQGMAESVLSVYRSVTDKSMGTTSTKARISG